MKFYYSGIQMFGIQMVIWYSDCKVAMILQPGD